MRMGGRLSLLLCIRDASPFGTDDMSENGHPRWQPRHQALLEFVLANPTAKREACARATGYSPWQVSRIINSPSFRGRLERAFHLRMVEFARLKADEHLAVMATQLRRLWNWD